MTQPVETRTALMEEFNDWYSTVEDHNDHNLNRSEMIQVAVHLLDASLRMECQKHVAAMQVHMDKVNRGHQGGKS